MWIAANNEKQSKCDQGRHVWDAPGTRRKSGCKELRELVGERSNGIRFIFFCRFLKATADSEIYKWKNASYCQGFAHLNEENVTRGEISSVVLNNRNLAEVPKGDLNVSIERAQEENVSYLFCLLLLLVYPIVTIW